MSIAPRHDRHKKCFAYCGDNRCNCSRRRQSHRKGHPMTDMDDEAMKAMVRRCIKNAYGNDVADQLPAVSRAVLFAIIETQELCAALAERLFDKGGCHAMYKNACHQAAAAIRSGQQFRKDV